eukprot:6976704-Pyramimonas_sp.AAC.1
MSQRHYAATSKPSRGQSRTPRPTCRHYSGVEPPSQAHPDATPAMRGAPRGGGAPRGRSPGAENARQQPMRRRDTRAAHCDRYTDANNREPPENNRDDLQRDAQFRAPGVHRRQ